MTNLSRMNYFQPKISLYGVISWLQLVISQNHMHVKELFIASGGKQMCMLQQTSVNISYINDNVYT